MRRRLSRLFVVALGMLGGGAMGVTFDFVAQRRRLRRYLTEDETPAD